MEDVGDTEDNQEQNFLPILNLSESGSNCNCGAVVQVQTNLLRQRIMNAVTYELAGYEQFMNSYLDSSRQAEEQEVIEDEEEDTPTDDYINDSTFNDILSMAVVEESRDKSGILSLAYKIIAKKGFTKGEVFSYAHDLCSNLSKLSNADRECVTGACKCLIDWLSSQPKEALEQKEWFLIVRRLCSSHRINSDSSTSGDDAVQSNRESQIDISMEIFRINMSRIAETNILNLLMSLCFTEESLKAAEDKLLEKSNSSLDLKEWYGRVTLLCALLDCGWERFRLDETRSIRICALTTLAILPTISSHPAIESGVFIRSIIQTINKIVHLTASISDGKSEFSKKMLEIYKLVIRKMEDDDDQEEVVASLINNINLLDGATESIETLTLLWEMVQIIMNRLIDEKSVDIKDTKKDESHEEVDRFLTDLVKEAIRDSIKMESYNREEICDWIVCALIVSPITVTVSLPQLIQVMNGCVSLSTDSGSSLSSNLARFYSKLVSNNSLSNDDQISLMKSFVGVWNKSNMGSLITIASRIIQDDIHGDVSYILSDHIVSTLCEPSSYLYHLYLLRLCMTKLNGSIRCDIALHIINNINNLDEGIDDNSKNDKKIQFKWIMYLVSQLHIVMQSSSSLSLPLSHMLNHISDSSIEKKDEVISRPVDATLFQSLTIMEEYTRMLGILMPIVFGRNNEKGVNPLHLPPINIEYAKRIVNQDGQLSFHHFHYFILHELFMKNNEYVTYIKEINGGVMIDALIDQLSSNDMINRITASLLNNILQTREMYPYHHTDRCVSVFDYILQCLYDGTIPFLQPDTLHLISTTITSVELRYVLSEYQAKPAEKDLSRKRVRKLIQISKCTIIAHEERVSLLDGLTTEIYKAITNVISSYKDSGSIIEGLTLQHKMIDILNHHLLIEAEMGAACQSFVRSYFIELKGKYPYDSLLYLFSHLITALSESPSTKLGIEMNHLPIGSIFPSVYITTSTMERLTRLICLLIYKDGPFKSFDWNEMNRDRIRYILDGCGDIDRGMESSLPIIVFIDRALNGDNIRDDFRMILIDYLKDKGIEFILRVLTSSPCRMITLYAMGGIIKYLGTIPEMDSNMKGMMLECLPLVFVNAVDELVDTMLIDIQTTDRFAQTCLKWRNTVYPLDLVLDKKDINLDPISDIFKLLSQLSFKELNLKLIEMLTKKLNDWLNLDKEDYKVLNGTGLAVSSAIIWKVQLVSESFSYIASLGESMKGKMKKKDANEEEESILYSDEEDTNDMVIEKEEREEEVRSVCTFVSTWKEFTKQHWYNCYTCDMVDTVGVCTVCALNCHRGHDLTYSKMGSFFCDCGERGCSSLNEVDHIPPVKRIRKKKSKDFEEMKRMKKEKIHSIMHIDDDLSIEELSRAMSIYHKVFMAHSSTLEAMIAHMEDTQEGKWEWSKRREEARLNKHDIEIKYEDPIMIGRICENSVLESLDRSEYSQDNRNANRDTCRMVRLNDGSTLLLYINEQSNILHMVYTHTATMNSSSETRIEKEELTFSPRRIAVEGYNIAITGIQDIGLYRISLDTGEIIHRDIVRLKDNTHNNVLVKAAWSNSSLIAIATLQYVRVFDLSKDGDNLEVELILPLGNVVDVTFILKKNADYMTILILCSAGHMYYHDIGGPGPSASILDPSRSIYLTNEVALPIQSSTVSFHYSSITYRLFISFQNAVYVGYVEGGDVTLLQSASYQKLDLKDDMDTLIGWNESDGVIGAISYPISTKIIFIYLTREHMLVQCCNLPQSVHSLVLTTSSTFDSIIGLAILSGYRKPAMLFNSNWSNEPDLWIKELPMTMDKVAMTYDGRNRPVQYDDMITVFERTHELKDVEYSSKALEVYYDNNELSDRLKTYGSRPITVLTKGDIDIRVGVTKRYYEIEGLRIEIDNEKSPLCVTLNGGRKIMLSAPTNRIFDVPLNESEMVTIDNELELIFNCRSHDHTNIVSIRAYGQSKEELYTRTLVPPPLSLPSLFILNMTRLLSQIFDMKISLDTEWCTSVSIRLITPRTYRPSLTQSGIELLRRLITPIKSYYEYRDNYTFKSLQRFREAGHFIPSLLIKEYIILLRKCLNDRFDNFVTYMNSNFSDALNLCSYLRQVIECMNKDERCISSLLSLYLQIICKLISIGHNQSVSLSSQMIAIVTSSKTGKLWQKFLDEIICIFKATKGASWHVDVVKIFVGKLTKEGQLEIPTWNENIGVMNEKKLNGIFHSGMGRMEALLGISIGLLRELSNESIMDILNDMIDNVSQGIMEGRDGMVITNVRIMALTTIIIDMSCRERLKKVKEEKESEEGKDNESRIIEDRIDNKNKDNDGESDESDGGNGEDEGKDDYDTCLSSQSIDKSLMKILLSNNERKELLMKMNFRLLTEALEFYTAIKDGYKVDSTNEMGNSITNGECLLQYYGMASRSTLTLPYIILSLSSNEKINEERMRIVCEFALLDKNMIPRKYARRLLMSICHNKKELYRRIKDEHIINQNLNTLRWEYLHKKKYSHEDLTHMMERTNRIQSIGMRRSSSWRKICEANLEWILLLACKVADPVAISIIELIQCATKVTMNDELKECDQSSQSPQSSPSPSIFSIADTLLENERSTSLLKVLIIRYLLGRDDSRRWLMHSLTRSLMQLAKRSNQVILIRLLVYQVYPIGREVGERGSQLADILSSYLPRLLPSNILINTAKDELNALSLSMKKMNESSEKNMLDSMVNCGLSWKDSLFIHTHPCIQCLTWNDVMEPMKLSSLKSEARFTTNAQMIKLNGQYELSKMIIKLSDVKKHRLFRRINLYYTNKMIESAVDLKSDKESWIKVSSVKTSVGDSEVVLALAIPIVTNGLVIEFTDFNDSKVQSEVHCPRCSAIVRPNPGLCDNCGENVFQCVKCRVINYDEKEPYLCSSCGYCKYARIDISIVGRIEPTVNVTRDKDKPLASRTSRSISRLLIDMEVSRAQLQSNIVLSESIVSPNSSLSLVSYPVEESITIDPILPNVPIVEQCNNRWSALYGCMKSSKQHHNHLVNQSIQLIGMREALRCMEKVKVPLIHNTINEGYYSSSNDCIGCLSSSMIHSLSILHSLCHDESVTNLLSKEELLYDGMMALSSNIDPLRNELESLLICLSSTKDGSSSLCSLTRNHRISPYPLASSLLSIHSNTWNDRMNTLIEMGIDNPKDEKLVICVLNVLIRWINEGRNVMDLLDRRKKRKELMDERGPSTSNGKKDEISSWSILHTIMNNDDDDEYTITHLFNIKQKEKKVDNLLWSSVFSSSLSIRCYASKLILSIASIQGEKGTVLSIVLKGVEMCRCIDPSRIDQFFLTFNLIIERGQTKLYLFQSNFHLYLMGIILSECKYVHEMEKKECSVHLTSGAFLSHCVTLLSNLFCGSWIESSLLSASRLSLIVPLLHSSIMLRRITLKKTRVIMRALNQLDNLLRRCTAKEGLSLLAATVGCIREVEDEKSRADVIGIILETLDPGDNDNDEFLIQIEKDPAQEDFLQGRMQHNPYKSGDTSMGPLMRNIKDKICRECELIALLEDDNGMELIVNGKIISLSLPVKLVYEKIWRVDHNGEPMMIMYRMRGLLGDALEPFVENIDDTHEGDIIGEEEATLLGSFLRFGGVDITLSLLSSCSFSPNGHILLTQLIKLLNHLMRLDKMKIDLIKEGAVSILLGVVREMSEKKGVEDSSNYCRIIHILNMIDSLVCDSKHHSIMKGIDKRECEWLINIIINPKHKGYEPKENLILLSLVTKILGNAVLGSEESENLIVERFKEDIKWDELNDEGIGRIYSEKNKGIIMERESLTESFCMIADGILKTDKGNGLKDKLIEAGVIQSAVDALLSNQPPIYGTVESTEWKSYLARPSLKLILRLLHGMAKGHERSQLEIAKRSLPILHRLEQVSSSEHVGTFAENVMEALKESEEVASQIERVRLETKQKKKQMAMAMRDKQLSKLGMKVGRGGEVKVSSRSIVNEPQLDCSSDPLTSCCICRESILNGKRVPATYAFASSYRPHHNLPSHCSTSLVVMVHVDCHYNAIRRSTGGRNSDEWAKASLHNSGAKCNIVVPIPIGEPSPSDWNAALHRLQGDLEVITPGGGPITRFRIFLDMCNLIRRFVLNRSFAESSGGGGRESNMQYLSILHLLALYLPPEELSCNMASERLNSFLLTELTVSHWNEQRMDVLRAFLRDIQIGNALGVARDSLLRESLLQWTLIDLYFNRVIPIDGEDRLSWLRTHFGETLTKTVELVGYFDTELVPIKRNEDLAQAIGIDLNDALSLSTVTTPDEH